MIRELVDDPLNQRVLDPACGSGTFVAEAVSHFIAAAGAANWNPGKVLNRLREAVTGIDVHPVAVHLARAAWTLAARPAIDAARDARHGRLPVHPGLPGRRPAAALPHRGPVLREGSNHPDHGR